MEPEYPLKGKAALRNLMWAWGLVNGCDALWGRIAWILWPEIRVGSRQNRGWPKRVNPSEQINSGGYRGDPGSHMSKE